MQRHVKYLRLARFFAFEFSKDPSTKCGSVILRPDNTIAGMGVNGFPRGCDDSPELFADRKVKYRRAIHAELNAIASAREPLHGCAIYVWPPAPIVCTCSDCAKLIIQTGITRVAFPLEIGGSFGDRWRESCEYAAQMYREVGVEVIAVPIAKIYEESA